MKHGAFLLAAALLAGPAWARKKPLPTLATAIDLAGGARFDRVVTISAVLAVAEKGQPQRLVKVYGQRLQSGWRWREDSEGLSVVYDASAPWARRAGKPLPSSEAATLIQRTRERGFWLLAPQGFDPAGEKYLGLGYFNDRLVRRVEAAAPGTYESPVVIAVDSATFLLHGGVPPDQSRWTVGDQRLVQNVVLVPFFLVRQTPDGRRESVVVDEFTLNAFVDPSIFSPPSGKQETP